jgi:putative aminopeptidase FrvX
MDREATFRLVSELVALPAPSGVEDAVDRWLEARLDGRGLHADPAGNRLLRIPGRGAAPATALTAHKDEISAIVKRVFDDGRVRLSAVGDAFPWVWGEGPVDLLGDVATVPAVVSFGSRHVSPESAQRALVDGAGVAWKDAWAETKHAPGELAAAGVRPGTRAVLPAARRRPTRLGPDGAFVAAPYLDDRLACAVLVLLAERLADPAGDVELVFTTREETGAMGARYYGRRTNLDRLVAVEVAPTAEEYGLRCGPEPVLIESDARSTLDHALGRELADAARAEGLEPCHVVLDRYGSDASNVYADGGIGRAACIAISTDNTHGCEIAHLDAVENVTRTLRRWLA